MANRKPGIEKALEYVNRCMHSGKLSARLPSIRVLAGQAGVSYVTMWRAVNAIGKKTGDSGVRGDSLSLTYKEKSLNDGGARRTFEESTFAYAPDDLLWQKTKNRFKKDILSGGYPPGQVLPSCKELRHRYDVSYHTFKKSLCALASEEIIRPYKKGYMVPPIAGSESSARVVALGCGWEDGRIWADFQDKNYFRILESECIQSKISLDVIVYYKENDRLRFIHSASGGPYQLDNENILGVIYIVANLQVDPREVLKELSRLKKPVAVLDVIGCFATIPDFPESRLVQFYTTTASALPAKNVAQYLLGLKHKRIAFISPFHRAPWSKIRFQSCASIYRDAGSECGVVPLVLDQYAFQWDYLQAPGKRDDLRSLISQYTKSETRLSAGFPGKFGRLRYGISKYLSDWNCAGGEIDGMMRPLFEKALRDTGITAWVMANDFAATLAIDYLKEQNLRVPEKVSIIAFDNTIDAMEYQITSYDFNNNGIVTMMLRYILAPSTLPANQRGRSIEVEGRIVVRRSTAPVRS
jgi:DNA-binding LacI/PurR family transcriptional regulator/DNA-binding transcriptional regulator YhcF (GntR family)